MRDRPTPLDGPGAPTMVPLIPRDVDRLIYCVNELVTRRSQAGVPVPNWMRDLGRSLNTRLLSGEMSVTEGMSAGGHGFGSSGSPLAQESLIGTTEAAEILAMSARQVRRIAADLEGRRVGAKLVFERSAVTEYQQAREAK